MSFSLSIPKAEVIENELARLLDERDAKLFEIRELYKVEIRRLRALLKIARSHPEEKNGE